MNCPKSDPRSTPRLLGAVLALALALTAGAHAADRKAASGPPIWPGAETATTVRELMPMRLMSGDEAWPATIARFVDVDPGSSPRNILLPAIGGAKGVPADAVILARFRMPAGLRVMLRDAEGGLLGMINGGDTPSVQWASFRAQTDRWDVRISTGREMSVALDVFLWGGATPVTTLSGPEQGVVRPANARTSGYALRFETDAPALVFNAAGERTRLRVIADGRVVAIVDAPAGRSGRSSLGIDLGGPQRRRVEVLVDEGALQSIDVVDVRHGIFAWKLPSPQVRMLVLGDDAAGRASRGYPWALASRLDFECWSLAWGDGASGLNAAGGMVPEELVAEDLAAANADVIVVAGGVVNEGGEGDSYADRVGLWLDSISRSARPEALKILLPPFATSANDRRARVLERVAKQRGFTFINWQGWITGADVGDLLEVGRERPTEAGAVYLGGRLADEFTKLELPSKARMPMLRRTALGSGN